MNFWLQVTLFWRSFFLQAGWNYVKYQNLGFAFIMLPFLRQLYKNDPDALPTVLQRYLDTFNTHPVMASFCYGALAKKETELVNTVSLTEYNERVVEWSGTRRGLSITAASIGDRLFWGALKPLTLLLAILIWMMQGVDFFSTHQLLYSGKLTVYLAPLTAFCVYNSIAWFVRWQGLRISYQSDESSCYGLTQFDWNRTIYYAKRIGLFFASGLILFGIYRYFEHRDVLDVYFVARSILVLFFILFAFVTHRLRIPNVYIYLMSVAVFTLVCLF